MGKDTGIEWCHHTFNPWWGCTKVSPACTHCYAEAWARRYGHQVWGSQAGRRTFGDSHWNEPLKWDRAARDVGERRRVFCASMADVFEDSWLLDEHRSRLWDIIEQTTGLDWLLLTKRPQHMCSMTPQSWRRTWPGNAWAGTTVEDQRRANERIPHLLKVPSTVKFLSCEPLLGPLDLTSVPIDYDGRPMQFDALAGHWHPDGDFDPGWVSERIHWVIAGGESGSGARATHPAWVRSLRDQCATEATRFFFKQWGDWHPVDHMSEAEARATYRDVRKYPDDYPDDLRHRVRRFDACVKWHDGTTFDGDHAAEAFYDATETRAMTLYRVGKKRAGRLFDGRVWNEIPTGVAG